MFSDFKKKETSIKSGIIAAAVKIFPMEPMLNFVTDQGAQFTNPEFT